MSFVIGKKMRRFPDMLLALDLPGSKQNMHVRKTPVRVIPNLFSSSRHIQAKTISLKEAIRLQARVGMVMCNQIESRV